MGEIHKIIKDGVVIYPATTTDAVVHPQLRTVISDTITEYNVTSLFPTSGSNNGNTYTLQSAISLLEDKLSDTQKAKGIKVIFIERDSSETQEWRYVGESFTDPTSWEREDSWYEDLQEEVEDLENNIINDVLRKSEQLLSISEKEQVKSNLDLEVDAFKITWSADENLNNYLSSGVYTITGYRVSMDDNMPIPESENNIEISGTLVVNSISSDIVGQTLNIYDNASRKTGVYCREFNEDGWSDWRKLLDSNEDVNIDIDITNYYTKEETNELVENVEQIVEVQDTQIETLENKINDIQDGTIPVAKADTLSTGRTIRIKGAVGSNTVTFDGSSNVELDASVLEEAYLRWGGKVISGSLSPIDAAMDSEFSSNRLSFLPAEYVNVEYSNDGGTTWIDYGLSNEGKQRLITSGFGAEIYLGKKSSSQTIDDQLRITLIFPDGYLFFVSTKLLIYASGISSANDGYKCNIEKLLCSYDSVSEDEKVFSTVTTAPLKGFGGWNSIPLSLAMGAQTNREGTNMTRKLRMTFFTDATSTVRNPLITSIRLFGPTVYSNKIGYLSKNNHMYTWDINKNVTFPANVSATNITSIESNITSLNNLNLDKAVCNKTFTGIFGTEDKTIFTYWWTLDKVTDSTNTPVIYSIRTYPHSSAVFIVSKGWSGVGNIVQLSYCSSLNSSYCNIYGARLLSDGTVEIRLNNGSSRTTISVTKIAASNIKQELPSDLILHDDTSTATVIQTLSFTDKAMSATNFVGKWNDKTVDDFATASHTHENYYNASLSRTANTILAAPDGSNGGATFRKIVIGDLPTGTSETEVAIGNHTHNYAGSSSAGGAANSVKSNLTVKLNGGTTEGTNLFTFNGSTTKEINITPDSINAATKDHTHSDYCTEDDLNNIQIDTSNLIDDSVTTGKIVNGAITEDKLSDDLKNKLSSGGAGASPLVNALSSYTSTGTFYKIDTLQNLQSYLDEIGNTTIINDISDDESCLLLLEVYSDTSIKQKLGLISDGGKEYNWFKGSSSWVDMNSGRLSNYPLVNHENTETTVTIDPNKFHVWASGSVSNLILTFKEGISDIMNEYLFQFNSGAIATTLTLPENIIWEEEPEITTEMTYQISIVNNLAVIMGFPYNPSYINFNCKCTTLSSSGETINETTFTFTAEENTTWSNCSGLYDSTESAQITTTGTNTLMITKGNDVYYCTVDSLDNKILANNTYIFTYQKEAINFTCLCSSITDAGTVENTYTFTVDEGSAWEDCNGLFDSTGSAQITISDLDEVIIVDNNHSYTNESIYPYSIVEELKVYAFTYNEISTKEIKFTCKCTWNHPMQGEKVYNYTFTTTEGSTWEDCNGLYDDTETAYINIVEALDDTYPQIVVPPGMYYETTSIRGFDTISSDSVYEFLY